MQKSDILVETMNCFEKIVYKTLCEKYGSLQNDGSKCERYEYSLDFMTIEEIEGDLELIENELIRVYYNEDINTFLLVYTEACNLCGKYYITNVVEIDEILNIFIRKLSDKQYYPFIREYGTCVLSQLDNEKSEEYDIFEFCLKHYDQDCRWEVIILYCFIYLSSMYFSIDIAERTEDLKQYMLETYYSLSEEMQQHVIGRNIFELCGWI